MEVKPANTTAALNPRDATTMRQFGLIDPTLSEAARTKDSLTGALSHPMFLAASEAVLLRARRYGHSLAVLTLELDHYEEITKSLGQTAGDLMIKGLASVVRTAKRPHDILGRTTRSSFAVLIAGLSGPETLALATRIQRQVGLLTNCSSLIYRRMTVSVGVAHYGRSDTKLQDLLRLADDALGTAKAKGPGRIEYRGAT